jgi:putative addiction module component (TIGR02574 family)
MTKDQVLTEALALDPIERDEVAQTLLQSVVPGEFDADQLAEIHHRIAAIEAGKSQGIPGEQVMRELRQRTTARVVLMS